LKAEANNKYYRCSTCQFPIGVTRLLWGAGARATGACASTPIWQFLCTYNCSGQW